MRHAIRCAAVSDCEQDGSKKRLGGIVTMNMLQSHRDQLGTRNKFPLGVPCEYKLIAMNS